MSDDQNTYCPCCGQAVVIHAIQTYPAKYNLPDRKTVHCVNPACPMEMQTSTDLAATWLEVQKDTELMSKLISRCK